MGPSVLGRSLGEPRSMGPSVIGLRSTGSLVYMVSGVDMPAVSFV